VVANDFWHHSVGDNDADDLDIEGKTLEWGLLGRAASSKRMFPHCIIDKIIFISSRMSGHLPTIL
jgi:hypothetical protein